MTLSKPRIIAAAGAAVALTLGAVAGQALNSPPAFAQDAPRTKPQPSPGAGPMPAPARTAPPPATPSVQNPIKYGPGWDAAKCASAKAQGQTTSKRDCPDQPAMPVPPKA
jgi:hypothetical protein